MTGFAVTSSSVALFLSLWQKAAKRAGVDAIDNFISISHVDHGDVEYR